RHNTSLQPPSTLFPYTTLFRSTQRNIKLTVTALDINPEAVALANGNFQNSSYAHRLEAVQADFKTFRSNTRFDLIISNPPYFERSEEHTSELQSRENLVCRLLL